MGRANLLVLSALPLLFMSGCKQKERLQQDEDLKAVVAADRRIAKQEDELLARRGALQRERATIRDKRDEIITRKLAISEGDTQARAELDQEESKLATLEASLVNQELGLNKKLQSLLDEKTGLVDKLGDTGSGREQLVARREYGVAMREKDVARREAELGRREKVLAIREQELAERQSKLCPRVATVVQTVAAAPAAPPSGGGSYARKDVEPVYKAALQAMQSKGILTADLPAGTDRLVTEVRHGVGKGDFVRAKYAADQLLATVRSMKIDRGFIGAKIGRLSSSIRSTPPSAGNKARVDSLFQQATAAYGDGRFVEANRLLNRIYALLH